MSSLSTVALMFGGQSPEHEVSVKSARNILRALDTTRFRIVLIGVDKAGCWRHMEPDTLLDPATEIVSGGRLLTLIPGLREGQIRYLHAQQEPFPQIDAVFPIIHGPYGEDGTLQGILRHLSLPFVGPDVAGSAICMDKDITKRLLRDADLLVADYLCFRSHEQDAIDYTAVINQLGSPVFVKPANMGSSVGVRKASTREEFTAAIHEAFRYDTKVLVESLITGREVECAVMGNEIPATTSVGEVVMGDGFYDYDSKYISATAAEVMIPASGIDSEMLAKLIQVARSAYQVLNCEGMARVDMFLCDDGRVYVNEVNTLPGFTNISMYPKLWEHAGTSYTALITALIELAQERAARDAALEKSR
ncbi:MAG: D-alanine--D-alanine ligase [Bacteroidia bacterium]|nr:D-alanine--D-alanine ligase [Bacteroidia bacterium]